jgi:hypothetical protein
MPDPTYSRQLLTDIRDLIEIVDRRLIQMRREGTPDAIGELEDIRVRLLALQASVAPNTDPDPSKL